MTLDEALSLALREAELDESSRAFVTSLLEVDDDSWRTCCGSNCKPCSTQLALAVDRVRELLKGA